MMAALFIRYKSISVAACLLLLALSVWALQHLPAWRFDLTEEKLYTLSDGSKQIVKELQRPVTLSLFFSHTLAKDFPQLKDYATRIEDLLNEYRIINPSLLRVELVDPAPFSDDEDRAIAAGLQGAPVTFGGDTFYLGLIVTDEAGATEVIPFFNSEREQFLEYDITRQIYRLSQSQKTVVGLLSTEPVLGGYDASLQQVQPSWVVIEQLQEVADVRQLPASLSAIEKDVDLLLLILSQELDQQTLHAIDQYALGGGVVAVFVDPYAEIGTQMNSVDDPAVSIETLLQSWGVRFSSDWIVADRHWGLRIAGAGNSAPLPHVGIVGLPAEGLNREDVITAELDSLNISSAGSLAPLEGATTRFTPLLTTSTDAMLIDRNTYQSSGQNPSQLLEGFVSAGESFVVAARITGKVKSMFAVREQGQVSDQKPIHSGDINAIVVADVDLLSDRLWVQVSDFFGQRVRVPWANNGDFLMNVVENLSGGEALIGLRSRGQYSRPFDVVNDLRARAADEYKQQEQALVHQLEMLESSIATLTPDVDETGESVLSAEQREQISLFEAQRLETRKQLRQVKHELNRSIDELENRLRWLNIGLLPLLLMLLMVAVLWRRQRRSGY